MRRRSGSLLLVLALLTTLAIVAIWTLIVPQYQARGVVRIRPGPIILAYRTYGDGAIGFYQSYVNTQASIMGSPDVLQPVLDQNAVRQTPWYKKPRRSIMQRLRGQTFTHMERLKNALSIQPRPRTVIIDVFFSAPSAEDAELILNVVLDQYVQYVRGTSIGRRVPGAASIASPATVPTKPHNDRRIPYTAITSALYLIVGGCIVILGRKQTDERGSTSQ